MPPYILFFNTIINNPIPAITHTQGGIDISGVNKPINPVPNAYDPPPITNGIPTPTPVPPVKTITATPNHKFLLRNKEYKLLKDLQPGDSLMPLYESNVRTKHGVNYRKRKALSENKKKYWEERNIPWIRSGELKDKRIKSSEKNITDLGFKESNAKKFPKNTVLIALTGATTGKTAILDIEATTNQSVTGIFPSPKFIPEYLWYYLRLNYEKIKNKSYGRAQQHIRQGIIEDLEILLPDLENQKKIIKIFKLYF